MSIDDTIDNTIATQSRDVGEVNKRRKINTNGNVKNDRPRTSRIFTPFRVRHPRINSEYIVLTQELFHLGFGACIVHLSSFYFNPTGENNLPNNDFGRPMPPHI